MYETPELARKALKRMFKNKYRCELEEGEIISPAEDALIRHLLDIVPIPRRSMTRKQKRRYIGLAKSLNLYPIPEWWTVREKLLKAKNKSTESHLFTVPQSGYYSINGGKPTWLKNSP